MHLLSPFIRYVVCSSAINLEILMNRMIKMMTGIVPFRQFDSVMHFELVVRKRMRPAKPADNHPSIANGLNEDMWKLLEMCWASDRKERPSFKEINKVLRSLEKKGWILTF